MRAFIIPAIAIVAGAGFFSSAQEAQARFSPQRIEAPSLVDNVACVTRRVRTVQPNGRVVYRTVRRCGVPAWQTRPRNCRMVRERVYRPNGTVIVRNVRRCR
ncbi:hypothetical protein MHY87_09520 [Microvirga sp. ACRRW]|uniref:hypothetical protein n=1 Tax=Microvirga sp. ACRRW TaxID=2918205 RepID=UPI001EF54AE9|nr:hypothetical protein [Microvirga sp. ACRRW]MCG7393143.1 hypothetical protein [Microvirga sp. ACRRW]